MSDATRNEPSGSAANQAWETLTNDEKNVLYNSIYDDTTDLYASMTKVVTAVESILAGRLTPKSGGYIECTCGELLSIGKVPHAALHAQVVQGISLSGLYGEGNSHE